MPRYRTMKCEACGHDNIDGARYCANCGVLLPAKTDDADPMVGKTIGGRYRVTGVLGEGGMGVVYVGEQQMGSTIRKVAVKTLHRDLSKDPSVIARFHRECGTVAQLEHPNTIKFYDFGSTDDGTLYIAMEFVDGKPLNEVIEKEGPLAPDRVITIMRQACGALDEAHRQGVIHRDLKPENLILTNRAGEQDFVKVLDFGIAARTESADASKEQKLTQQGMVLGTPPYMSPEQFTGKALDARSDIYSLGVMAYEMLTGRLPFDADTPWQWATQHMTAQPIPFEVSAPSKNVPDGMRQAILRALSKDREQRQETARQFFAQLSEGERMTLVEDHARQGTGTAAMPAAPDFVAAPVVAATAPLHTPAAMSTTPAVAPHVPPAPGTSRKSGGNKGVIVGLASVAALLLIGMAVLAARSLKPSAEDEPPLAAFGAGEGTVAEVQPEAPAEQTPEQPTSPEEPVPDTAQPVARNPTGKKGTGTSTKSPAPTGTAPAGSSSAPAGQPTGTTSAPPATTTPPAGGGDACDQCLPAVRSGNFSGAVTHHSNCSDSGKKAKCAFAAAAKANQYANNRDCAKAKAGIAAAEAMGGHPLLAKAKASCP